MHPATASLPPAAAPLDRAKLEALFPADHATGRRCIIRAVDVRKTYRTGQVETHALCSVTSTSTRASTSGSPKPT